MMEIQHCGIAQPKHVQIKKQTCGKTCVCQRCPNLFISMFKIFFLFSTTDLYRYLSKSQKSPLNLPWVYSIHFRLESNFHLEPWIWNSFRDNQSSPVSCSNSIQHPKQLHLLSLFPVVDFKINRVSSKPQKTKTRVGWDSDSWVLVFFKKKKKIWKEIPPHLHERIALASHVLLEWFGLILSIGKTQASQGIWYSKPPGFADGQQL